MTRRRTRTAAVLAVVVALGCRAGSMPGRASAVAEPSGGCRSGTVAALAGEARAIVVEGRERRYLIDAPAGPADVARPLVLAFHGFRHSAAGLRAGLDFAGRAAAGAFVAVYPEGRDDVRLLERVGRGWDVAPEDTRDAAFVEALLDAVEAAHCIDRRRVYATGFSNGGFVANLLGCRLADRLAAVAPVAGARPLDACRPAAPMPILLLHGTADRVVPPRLTRASAAWWRRANRCDDGETADGACRSARGCAADVVVCEGPQGHVWPEAASATIWHFFEAHPRR
jgi:polyhydroxybutyrate depolymerase